MLLSFIYVRIFPCFQLLSLQLRLFLLFNYNTNAIPCRLSGERWWLWVLSPTIERIINARCKCLCWNCEKTHKRNVLKSIPITKARISIFLQASRNHMVTRCLVLVEVSPVLWESWKCVFATRAGKLLANELHSLTSLIIRKHFEGKIN